jgi:hypothetical protein
MSLRRVSVRWLGPVVVLLAAVVCSGTWLLAGVASSAPSPPGHSIRPEVIPTQPATQPLTLAVHAPSKAPPNAGFTMTVTVAGGKNPSGNVFATAFLGSTVCSPTVSRFSYGTTISGDGTYSISVFNEPGGVNVGTYYWQASLAADTNNPAAESSCGGPGAQTVIADAVPTLTLSAPTSVTLGSPIADNAALAGASTPGGTITFRVYTSNNCASGSSIITDQTTATVTANGNYQSAPVTLASPGDYGFEASYSGDPNNDPVTSSCEAFTVGSPGATPTPTPTPTPTASSTAPPGGSSAPAFLADHPPRHARAGHAYHYRFTASGSPAPVFKVASGHLPPGLTLDASTGLLSGKPHNGGPYAFFVEATNSVAPPALSEVIKLVVDQHPTLGSARLPVGLIGHKYAYRVHAAGYPKPHVTISKGKLPPGLHLNAATGRIIGTPTKPGTYHFVIEAHNNAKHAAHHRERIVIGTG